MFDAGRITGGRQAVDVYASPTAMGVESHSHMNTMPDQPRFARGWMHRKSVADAVRDLDKASSAPRLKRVLGRVDLLLVGVGVIVGGGIFLVTGTAAAQFAGPAVILSFLLAGLACALTGVCYAELAAMIPAAGSAYARSCAGICGRRP